MFDAVLILVFATVLIEKLLTWRWNAIYFRFGLPVFRARIECSNLRLEDGLEDSLNQAFDLGDAAGLSFHRLSESALAFRRQKYKQRFRYSDTSAMRGMIEYHPYERAITVVGRLNWTAMVVIGLLARELLSAPHNASLVFLGGIGVAEVISYTRQILRYRKVTDVVRRLVGARSGT